KLSSIPTSAVVIKPEHRTTPFQIQTNRSGFLSPGAPDIVADFRPYGQKQPVFSSPRQEGEAVLLCCSEPGAKSYCAAAGIFIRSLRSAGVKKSLAAVP
ncbi:hypothetical protein, partial [Paracoccus sp. IB05]|uniref:hypothetical protein n=1 Tax=Paracoccus sp. IB05 TaxID=2779367 RepID=UPI0018E86AEB